MIVMDRRMSTIGAVTARDLANQRVVLEFTSVDRDLASEKGVRAELQKRMNMLAEYRRNCDGREAWLVVVSQLSLQDITAHVGDLIPPEGVHCVAITAPPAPATASAVPGAAAGVDARTLATTKLC
jgi:hypothetical protein